MRAWIIPFVLCAAALAAPAHALDVPPLRGRVNDYANVLSSEQAARLEAKLLAYERETSQQFTLLTVPSLAGEDIASFGIRVGDEWKVGDAKDDDGLVLIVVPQERKLRIEVGYGLEGSVPDAVSARIIREVLAPALRRNDFAGGIDAAFDALMLAASGKAPPEAPAQAEAPQREVRRSVGLLGQILLPLILFFVFNALGGGRRGRRRGGGMWIAPMIGAGFGGGGFGGGRGGGGGFRGGGGGFGGGGASGGW